MAEDKLKWKEDILNSRNSDTAEADNFRKVIRGEQPDWIPNYFDAADWVFTDATYHYIQTPEQIDLFGVKWLVHEAGEMPDPHREYLDDIANWRDFVRLPDLDSFDWEAMAEADLSVHDKNKFMIYAPCASGGTLFVPLMNMMGFENGLCALMEDPEACHEMFDTFTTIFETVMRKQIPVYKPEMVYINDDMATVSSPFLSVTAFNEMFRPYYQRMINVAKEFGLPVLWHMCGKCQPIMEELISMGVDAWEVAQPTNDLAGMKKKYGNKLVMIGGWDSQGPAGLPGAPEDVVRQSVHTAMDMLGEGGGYVFWNLGAVGRSADQLQKMDWLDDEARKYGREFYKTH